jgi:hypothetical protein
MVSLELASKIKAASTVRETREDVIEYYQERYPGQKIDKKGNITYEWKTHLVEDLQGFTTAKSGGLMAKKDIARRFQKDTKTGKMRYETSKTTKSQQEEYAALGEYLPRKAPNAIRVHGNICIRYMDNPCEPRYIDEIFEGEELKYLLQEMDMQVIVNKYMEISLDEPEPTLEECSCSDPDCTCDFDVEAVNTSTTTVKNKRAFSGGNKGATTKTKLPGLLQSMKSKQQTKPKTQEELIQAVKNIPSKR